MADDRPACVRPPLPPLRKGGTADRAGAGGGRTAGSALELVFPDPQGDLARVRAKQLLARLFRDERAGWDEELKAYRALHGNATGDFAGRQGNFADTLQLLAGQPEALAAPPCDEPWTTFAGSPARNRVLPRAPSRLPWTLTTEDTHWPKRLDDNALRPLTEMRRHTVVPLSVAARSLAFHPLIVGDQVLVADARRVSAYDLRTGERTVWYDLTRDAKYSQRNLSLQLPAEPDLRYTLSIAEDRVYARLGAPGLGPRKTGHKNGESDSFLVCLNVQAERGGRERWVQSANKKDSDEFVDMFEGCPVVHDGRVYVAVTRFAGTSALTSIACYDADSGAPRCAARSRSARRAGTKRTSGGSAITCSPWPALTWFIVRTPALSSPSTVSRGGVRGPSATPAAAIIWTMAHPRRATFARRFTPPGVSSWRRRITTGSCVSTPTPAGHAGGASHPWKWFSCSASPGDGSSSRRPTASGHWMQRRGGRWGLAPTCGGTLASLRPRLPGGRPGILADGARTARLETGDRRTGRGRIYLRAGAQAPGEPGVRQRLPGRGQ